LQIHPSGKSCKIANAVKRQKKSSYQIWFLAGLQELLVAIRVVFQKKAVFFQSWYDHCNHLSRANEMHPDVKVGI